MQGGPIRPWIGRRFAPALGFGVLLFGLAWVAYKTFGAGFGINGGVPDWIRVTLSGLTLAGLYFVIASGFTLIFGLMRVVNMAHGSLYLLGAYAAFEFQQHNLLSWGWGVVVSSLTVGVAGLVMHQVFLRWNQGQELRQALITIALSLVFADQMLAYFGGGQHYVHPPNAVAGNADFGIYCTSGGIFGGSCLTFPWFRFVALGAAVAVALGLFVVLKKTRFGMFVRAGVDDRAMVAACGVDVDVVNAAAFFLGSMLAGLGGSLAGVFLVIAPGEDADFLLKALIVVIIGGMGSLGGAAIGALALGMVETWSPQYLPGAWSNYSILLTFLLLVFVLAVRPFGLFGRPDRSAVESAPARARLPGSVRAAPVKWINWSVAGGILVFLVVAPPLHVVSDFNLSQVGVRSLWLGIAAASVVFLASYGGMVSLAQTAVYGVAGFTYADLVVKSGWSQWPAIFAGIGTAVLVGLAVGLVSSRTTGIYFLMLTLAVGVIAFYFYLQVEQLSGQTGLHLDRAPALVGGDTISHSTRLYYASLIVSAAVYAFIRYLVRTPFGIVLQGIRDEPVRMRSLGYNVALHRALAFGVGALIASLAGILSVFFNLQISPSSIDINQIIIVLAIAVVGGLTHLEGAWIGATVYAVLAEYTQPWAGHLPSFLQKPLGSERYPTWLGLVFLVIVLGSPGGLMGIWHGGVEAIGRRLGRGGRGDPAGAASVPVERAEAKQEA